MEPFSADHKSTQMEALIKIKSLARKSLDDTSKGFVFPFLQSLPLFSVVSQSGHSKLRAAPSHVQTLG